MNICKGDYLGLVNELQTVRGKEFSTNQSESLIASFKTIEWGAACWIVKSVTRLSNLPNNLYGLILDRIDQKKYNDDKNLEKKTTWKAEEGCLSPEEFYTGMMCLSKIAQMDNRRDRFEKFAAASGEAIDRKTFLPFLKSSLILAEEYLQNRFQQKKDSVMSQLSEFREALV